MRAETVMLTVIRVVFGWCAAVFFTSCAISLFFVEVSQIFSNNAMGIFSIVIMLVAISTLASAAIVIAAAEYCSIRHPIYYVTSGLIAGVIGWMFFFAKNGDAAFLIPIVPGGALGGFIYWLVAGRSAGNWRNRGTSA